MNQWFQKSKKGRNANMREKEQQKRHPKQKITPLEKAKREYELWVLAEEYEEEDK